jgi:DeoR/GlpR family transcriptional regulator of sugar metabolism
MQSEETEGTDDKAEEAEGEIRDMDEGYEEEKKDDTDRPLHQPYAKAQVLRRPIEKALLAKHVAVKLIKPETTVFLDAGSTIRAIAQAIFKRESYYGEQMKICILTNNMMIFEDFNRLPPDHSLSLVLTGGEYDRQHEALFGCVAETTLSETIKCHMSFIGTSGLILAEKKEGIYSQGGFHSHGLTAEKVTKQAIFQKKVEHCVIVSDHTKLGREDTLRCGQIKDSLNNADRCTIVVGEPNEIDYKLSQVEKYLTSEDVKKIREILDGEGDEKKKIDNLTNDIIKEKKLSVDFDDYGQDVTNKHDEQQKAFEALVVELRNDLKEQGDVPKNKQKDFPLQLRKVRSEDNWDTIPGTWAEAETYPKEEKD